ncbi:MAG: asparagine synthase-related protein [Burkholderiaceae bacterium]
MSGGIDSSLVVASMLQASARSVITNTIGFDDDAFSETEVARATAGHLQTNHHEFTVRPDAVDVLPRIAATVTSRWPMPAPCPGTSDGGASR